MIYPAITRKLQILLQKLYETILVYFIGHFWTVWLDFPEHSSTQELQIESKGFSFDRGNVFAHFLIRFVERIPCSEITGKLKVQNYRFLAVFRP